MAWQAPKTNWTGSDGVRDIDLNRIEGNILELYGDNAHTDFYVYVSASNGDDNSGTGTAAQPYRTIGKALSAIPRNLNGKDAIISIYGGYYPESVNIKGFDAPITITTSGDEVTVTGFRVDGCHCSFSSADIVSNGVVYITNCGTLTGAGIITVNGAHVSVNYGSTLSLDTVVCNDSPGFAIAVDSASRFYAAYLDGNANSNGLSSQGGSVLAFGDINMEIDSVIYFTAIGGRIYSGTQPTTQLP